MHFRFLPSFPLLLVPLCFECVPLGYYTDLKPQTISTSALQSGKTNLRNSIKNGAAEESAFRAYTPSQSSQPTSPDKQQRRYTPTGTSGYHAHTHIYLDPITNMLEVIYSR